MGKRIEIRDYKGRLVKEIIENKEISIGDLQSGMYVVYAITELSTSTGKFCKF